MAQPDTQARSVCQSPDCAIVFDGLASHCPQCGSLALPQSSIRVRGAVLILCGLVILGVLAVAGSIALPSIVGGPEQDGSDFTGTTGDAVSALAVFAVLAAIGASISAAGWTQLRYGRQNWRAIAIMGGSVTTLFFIYALIRLGLIL